MFQSSPAPKGRCNDFPEARGVPRVCVSILTGPEGPMQQALATVYARRPAFQSSPAPKGRCNRPDVARIFGEQRVSILTGPEGPMQRRGRLAAARFALFQSSPAPKGRCNQRVRSVVRRLHGFQSSPAPKGRCNANLYAAYLSNPYVSILTGPEGPMQLATGGFTSGSRRFNPHRPRRADATGDAVHVDVDGKQFQSSPAPKGRCNVALELKVGRRKPFQSSPAPKGRCNFRCSAPCSKKVRVSILTGPEGPMQPSGYDASRWLSWFQSSPAPKGRCNLPHEPRQAADAGFNPHRPRRADATRTARSLRHPPRFQSSPAPKGRCNRRTLVHVPVAGVSILTGPEGPMQPAVSRHRCPPELVSILTGPEGPMQLFAPSTWPPASPCFNPHRPRRADATPPP